jgi:uroporphyrinogen-III synthase
MRSPSSPCRVLVTRATAAAAAWLDRLAHAGFAPIPYPTIEVGPPNSLDAAEKAVSGLGGYEWLVFTSAAAARAFVALLPPSPRDPTPKIAAVGEQTARALQVLGLHVDRIPDDRRQEGLMGILRDLAPGTRVLFPQAERGRPDLAQHLRARGCVVDVVPVTRTRPIHPLPPLPEFDIATFASPSAVEAFVAAHGVGPLKASPVVSIGPTTAATLRAHGIAPVVADEPSPEGLVRAVARVPDPRHTRT